jgi:hypothetical protein
VAKEKDEGSVIGVPTATMVVRDEGVRGLIDLYILSIEALREDADVTTRIVRRERVRRSVDAVLSRKEHRSCAEHDSWVIDDVRVIKGD